MKKKNIAEPPPEQFSLTFGCHSPQVSRQNCISMLGITHGISRLSLDTVTSRDKWGDLWHCCKSGHSNNLELFGEGQPLRGWTQATFRKATEFQPFPTRCCMPKGPTWLWCLTSMDPTALLTPKKFSAA